jgi:hypothetical protein
MQSTLALRRSRQIGHKPPLQSPFLAPLRTLRRTRSNSLNRTIPKSPRVSRRLGLLGRALQQSWYGRAMPEVHPNSRSSWNHKIDMVHEKKLDKPPSE